MIQKTTKTVVISSLWGLASSVLMLVIYFGIVTSISGRYFAVDQFYQNWYFLISLSIGFGVQIALYQYIKSLMHKGLGMRKVIGVSGTTSTAAMVSCCAHYLVNILPILGVTGLVVFVAQYQTELFWVGIFFNIIGIGYMVDKIISLKK
ncbi:MAG: hypothetical protein ACYC1K_01575 [Minisyncoccota bacterium]